MKIHVPSMLAKGVNHNCQTNTTNKQSQWLRKLIHIYTVHIYIYIYIYIYDIYIYIYNIYMIIYIYIIYI